MTSRKKNTLTKYCRIYQWIENEDPDFAATFRDLCMEGSLSPGAKSPGVTFLYPNEKSYRDEIISKAYSDNIDDAIRMLESLIIPDILKTASDFNNRSIGSKLGVKYVVQSADQSKIILAGGVELTPSKFKPTMKKANNLAVWLVTKGKLPLTGDPYRPPMGSKFQSTRVGGNGSRLEHNRPKLAASIESEFDMCMKKDLCASYHPYLSKVVSLLNFLKINEPLTFTNILPVIDYDPVICFYLLIEPYKTTGNYLLNDEILFGSKGWNCIDLYGDAVQEYKQIFDNVTNQNEMLTSTQSGIPAIPLAFKERQRVMSQIDITRQNITSINPMKIANLVHEAYNLLVNKNTIQGLEPVLPDGTLVLFKDNRKLWQDEFRFVFSAAMYNLRSEPYDSRTFTNIIRDLRLSWPGNNYLKETKLTNIEDLKFNVSPRTELLLLIKFINSSDFLYMTVPTSEVGENKNNAIDPTDKTLYNRNAIMFNELSKITQKMGNGEISDRTFKEIELYVKRQGKLPSSILSLQNLKQ
jgi:hypothetical protein